MKLLFSFILFLSFATFSQQDTIVYQYCDEDPSFPGGFGAMMSYFLKNLDISSDSFEDYSCSIINYDFIVEIDGSLSDVKETSPCLYTKNYTEVFNTSPKWNPAKINGKVVRSRYRLPFRICPE